MKFEIHACEVKMDYQNNFHKVLCTNALAILGPPGGHFGFCRQCHVAGGDRVPPLPLGWYFNIIFFFTFYCQCISSGQIRNSLWKKIVTYTLVLGPFGRPFPNLIGHDTHLWIQHFGLHRARTGFEVVAGGKRLLPVPLLKFLGVWNIKR